jgi:hypothetical protein
MDTNNLKGLMEAYSEVYASQEVDEAVKGADPEMRKAASAERRGGDKRLSPSKGKGYADQQKQSISYMDKVTKKNKNVVGLVTKEELDIFDVVLEFLQTEGIVKSLEEAKWLMVNELDSEDIDAILEASYSAKAARAGKDIGKPGKAFAKIAASAGKRYGSKERGEKVAGAVLAKLRAKRG